MENKIKLLRLFFCVADVAPNNGTTIFLLIFSLHHLSLQEEVEFQPFERLETPK